MAGTSPAMPQPIEVQKIVMPGFVPGIHEVPSER
jgi:hypothetical protein